jgi:hypothetical protein
MFIPDPDLDFLTIPDPGIKKAMDPGSGSATLLNRMVCFEVEYISVLVSCLPIWRARREISRLCRRVASLRPSLVPGVGSSARGATSGSSSGGSARVSTWSAGGRLCSQPPDCQVGSCDSSPVSSRRSAGSLQYRKYDRAPAAAHFN